MDALLESFDQRFRLLHERSCQLLKLIDSADLFRKPRELERSMAMFSCGEYLLRSAGAVEQTFGGITTRLWDDPFEWTLPEKLSTPIAVLEYLDEVWPAPALLRIVAMQQRESRRIHGFSQPGELLLGAARQARSQLPGR